MGFQLKRPKLAFTQGLHAAKGARAIRKKAAEGREGSTAVAAYVDLVNKRISVANAGVAGVGFLLCLNC